MFISYKRPAHLPASTINPGTLVDALIDGRLVSARNPVSLACGSLYLEVDRQGYTIRLKVGLSLSAPRP